MKMMKILIAGSFATLLMASCSKDYRCYCTSDTESEKDIEFTAKNESDAQAKCDAEEGASYGSVFTCTLQEI